MQLLVRECAGAAPTGTTFPAMAFDPVESTIYVFGGTSDANQPTDHLFRIRLAAEPIRWEKIDATPRPSPRNGVGMVFDVAKRRLIAFAGDGGSGNSFQPLGDLWQFDVKSATWSPLQTAGPAPNARWHPSMVVDNVSHRAYLFGGAGKGQLDEELYELDLLKDAWRILPCAGSCPPSSQGGSLTFDEKNRVLVLAGGL